jgi:metal-responsive CopG/Arc/MetJ family transcriptional regulator
MTRAGYSSISIPQSFIAEIDHFINTDKHGYASRSEFFKDAARRHIQKLKTQGAGNNSHLSTNNVENKTDERNNENANE